VLRIRCSPLAQNSVLIAGTLRDFVTLNVLHLARVDARPAQLTSRPISTPLTTTVQHRWHFTGAITPSYRPTHCLRGKLNIPAILFPVLPLTSSACALVCAVTALFRACPCVLLSYLARVHRCCHARLFCHAWYMPLCTLSVPCWRACWLCPSPMPAPVRCCASVCFMFLLYLYVHRQVANTQHLFVGNQHPCVNIHWDPLGCKLGCR